MNRTETAGGQWPLGVAIIGAGAFGTKRAQALRACQGGRLLAVADSDPRRAQALASAHSVMALSIGEVMADRRIDCVIVSAPNNQHSGLIKDALRAGKAVLCEKPLAETATHAAEIVAVVAETGGRLKVGSNHRYFAPMRKARELIDAGAIGRVISLVGRIGHNGERIHDTWYWDPAVAGGGTLIDNAWHLIDLAQWYMGGLVSAIGARANSHWQDCALEDTAAAIFLTADGRMATIASSWRLFSGYLTLELNGDRGFITIDCRNDVFGRERLHWRSSDSTAEPVLIEFPNEPRGAQTLELEEFFQNVATGVMPSPSATDGLRTLRLIEAAYRSRPEAV